MIRARPSIYTLCPRSSDPFYIVSYFIRWVTTYNTFHVLNRAMGLDCALINKSGCMWELISSMILILYGNPEHVAL